MSGAHVSSAFDSLRAGVATQRGTRKEDNRILRPMTTKNCSMAGQFHPRGVKMRDCLNSRGGFDRVLVAVAASFLTVSATSGLAQDQRSTAAELAIDAAIPRPELANVPPPSINDFKMDTTASVPETRKPEAAKTTDVKTP